MRRALKVLLVLLLLLAGAAAATAWRLAQGPLALTAIEPVLEALLARGTPFVVTFAAPALAWSVDERRLALTAQDVEVRTRAGEFVMSAPEAAVVVDAVRLVRDRALVPVELDIVLPELELVRSGPGSLELAFAGQLATLPMGVARGGADPIAYLLGSAQEAPDPRLRRLERLRVRAPVLQFVDVVSGRRLTAETASVELAQALGGWSAALTADLAPGPAEAPARLQLAPEPDGSGADRVVLELAEVPVEQLADLWPVLPDGALRGEVSGSLSFRLDRADTLPSRAAFAVRLDDGALAWPERLAGPILVERLAAEGTLDPLAQTAVVDVLFFRSGSASVEGEGTVALADDALALAGAFQAEGVDVATVLRFWPLEKGRNARAWVVRNLEGGDVAAAKLEARLPLPGAAAPGSWTVELEFAVSDLAARYLGDLPPATGLAGTGRLNRERLELKIAAGRVDEVALASGTLQIVPLNRREEPPRLTTELALAGPLRPALLALDAAPLGFPAKAGIAPGEVDGRFSADFALAMPLVRGVKAADIDVRLEARLEDASLADAWREIDLEGGELTLTLADDILTAEGTAAAAQVPVRFEWRERLPLAGRPGRRVTARATLDRAAAERLGFAWPAMLAGAVGVEAVMEAARGGRRRFEIAADLTETSVGIPALGVTKLMGAPGRASFRVVEGDENALSVDQVEVELPDLAVRGQAELRLEPFDWRRLRLSELTTPVTRLSADLAKREGRVTGTINASRLDLRPWRRREGTAARPLRLPPLELQLHAEEVLLDDTPIPRVTGSVVRDAAGWQRVELSGRLAPGGTFSMAYAAQEDGGTASVRAEDGGAFLQALGVAATRIAGGQLQADATLSGPRDRPAVEGEVTLRDFTLRESPVIARIFTLASLQGLASALTGGGIPITRLEVPFAYQGGRIEIEQARVVGSEIGARADGSVNLDTRVIDLEGTVAPIYTLNRILGRIPLVGDILRGERADAALAATFAVKGDLGAPEITVNPLAALVPGIIRDLFRGLVDGEAQDREPEPRD